MGYVSRKKILLTEAYIPICNKYQGCVSKVTFAMEYLRIEDHVSLVVWAIHTNSGAYFKQNSQSCE